MSLILGVHLRFHIGYNSLKKLGWLDTQKRVNYLTVSLVYRMYNEKEPSYMSNRIHVSDRHSYQTRHSDMNFIVPHVKQHEHKGFMHNGIKLWNKPRLIFSLVHLYVSLRENPTSVYEGNGSYIKWNFHSSLM